MRKLFLAAVLVCAACELFVSTSDLDNGKPTPTPPLDGSTGDVTTAPPGDTGNDAGLAEAYRLLILSDAPDGYWRLNDAANATVAKDELSGHDGAYASVVPGQPGPFAGRLAAQFDGTSSRIELPDGFAYTGTSSWTIEAWADPTGSPDCNHIFTREDRGIKRGYALLQLSSDGFKLERYVDGGQMSSAASGTRILLPQQTFSHVVATYDGEVMRTYINAKLVQTSVIDQRPIEAFSITPFIGAAGAGDCVWSGSLAEVAVYPKALTIDRVAAHYAARF